MTQSVAYVLSNIHIFQYIYYISSFSFNLLKWVKILYAVAVNLFMRNTCTSFKYLTLLNVIVISTIQKWQIHFTGTFARSSNYRCDVSFYIPCYSRHRCFMSRLIAGSLIKSCPCWARYLAMVWSSLGTYSIKMYK